MSDEVDMDKVNELFRIAKGEPSLEERKKKAIKNLVLMLALVVLSLIIRHPTSWIPGLAGLVFVILWISDLVRIQKEENERRKMQYRDFLGGRR